MRREGGKASVRTFEDKASCLLTLFITPPDNKKIVQAVLPKGRQRRLGAERQLNSLMKGSSPGDVTLPPSWMPPLCSRASLNDARRCRSAASPLGFLW